jgi:hypothetical protein
MVTSYASPTHWFATAACCAAFLFAPTAAQAAVVVTASTNYNPVLFVDGGINSTFMTIAGLTGPISGVTTTINLTKSDDPISSTGDPLGTGDSYNDEIGLTLKSPFGTLVNLIVPDTLGGQEPGARVTWTFDDAALGGISGDLLLNGTYLPASPLSAFNGEAGNGSWELIYIDDAEGDPLTINSWSLSVTGAGNAIPEPGTWAAAALLAGGAAFMRWRKRHCPGGDDLESSKGQERALLTGARLVR